MKSIVFHFVRCGTPVVCISKKAISCRSSAPKTWPWTQTTKLCHFAPPPNLWQSFVRIRCVLFSEEHALADFEGPFFMPKKEPISLWGLRVGQFRVPGRRALLLEFGFENHWSCPALSPLKSCCVQLAGRSACFLSSRTMRSPARTKSMPGQCDSVTPWDTAMLYSLWTFAWSKQKCQPEKPLAKRKAEENWKRCGPTCCSSFPLIFGASNHWSNRWCDCDHYNLLGDLQRIQQPNRANLRVLCCCVFYHIICLQSNNIS